MKAPRVLITGAAKRIGAAISRKLHSGGYDVILHYRHSSEDADQLASALNAERPHSASTIQADLNSLEDINRLAEDVSQSGTLTALVNNASTFYPTKVGEVSPDDWDTLINSNVKGAFFLCQALAPQLRSQKGAIVNMVDIFAESPLRGYSTYCIAKAGLAMMTKSLALELAPDIRVNGIAPGTILWPSDGEQMADEQANLRERIPLQRIGKPEDIARTVLFLIDGNEFITGQIIAVDGGRSL